MVVQLLEVINKVTEEMGEMEENVDDADLIEITEETIEKSPWLSQWLAQAYQWELYFVKLTNKTVQTEYV